MDHHHSSEEGKEPLLHTKHTRESHGDDDQVEHSAHQISNEHARGNEYDNKELLEQNELKLRPVFGDPKFSIFSMNYGLYLEFFHILVRMLRRLLLLVIFFNLIDMFPKQQVFISVSFLSDEVLSICAQYPGKEDICTKELYILSICYRHSVRIAYALVTSFGVAIFMAIFRRRDEGRVINNRMLYEFNWTQDLFSVLIDNIPKRTVADELREHFDNLPALKEAGGHVKDVVMVQDFGKCYLINKQIKKLTKQIEQMHEKGQKGQNVHELEGKVQFLREEVVREEARMPPHSGRAIIVFDSLKTKALVMEFSRPAFEALIKNKFRRKENDTEPEEVNWTVRDLPEPQDLLFENLCYPRSQKITRLILVYALGLLIVVVGAAAVLWLEILPKAEKFIENSKHQAEQLSGIDVKNGEIFIEHKYQEEHDQSIFQQILIPVMLLVLEGVSESLFKKLNSFTRHKSHSEIEIACLNYSIFSSFFLYLFIQGAMMVFAWDEARQIVETTIEIFCYKYIGKKLASAYFAYKNKHVGGEHGHKKKNLHLILLATAVKILFHVDIENEKFDFFEEASRAFPLIAMNFAFLTKGRIVIRWYRFFSPVIPFTILAIYIGAFCDKYRLINTREHCHLNSARFMLKMFRFLRGDHFAAIFGAGIWTFSFYFEVSRYQKEILQIQFVHFDKELILSSLNTSIFTPILTVMIIISCYILYLIVRPKRESLESQLGKKFLENKGSISYDSVSSHFTAVYQKPIVSDSEEHKLKESLIL